MQTLAEKVPPSAIVEQWHAAADERAALILACMELEWSQRDTFERLVRSTPRDVIRSYVERYVPDEIEKAMIWHGRSLDSESGTTIAFITTWDGVRHYTTPPARAPEPDSPGPVPCEGAASSQSSVSPKSAMSDYEHELAQGIRTVGPFTDP